MTVTERSSTSSHRPYPTAVHYHQNQPVVYPYKPPEKADPPGAHLYKDIWFIFKVATQAFLWNCHSTPYTAGFALGVLKGLYDWSEIGPPKKISSDAEMIDFGATAHTSSLVNQFCILFESFIAVAVPTSIHHFFPDPDAQQPEGWENFNPFERAVMFKGSNKWPTNYPQLFAWGFVARHALCAGEEVVQRFAKWIDTPQEKKKSR